MTKAKPKLPTPNPRAIAKVLRKIAAAFRELADLYWPEDGAKK